MISYAPEGAEAAVILLSRQGSVLASAGLPELLGPARERPTDVVDLGGLLRGERDEDLTALARRVGTENPGWVEPSVLVRPTQGAYAGILRLTLMRIGVGLVAGIVSGPDAERPLDVEGAASLVEPAWASLRDPMILTTPADAPDGPEVVSCNPAFCTLSGMSEDEVRGRPLTDFLAPEDGPRTLSRLHSRRNRAEDNRSALVVLRGAGGKPTLVEWEVAPIRDHDARTVSLISVLKEVTTASIGTPIHRGPELDPPTGLPNRMHFRKRLQRFLDRGPKIGAESLAVIGLKMTGLRELEERMGTVMSATVLDALVWRLRHRLRSGDLIARTGEQELAILLDHFRPWGAVDEVLARVRSAASDSFTVAGKRISLSVVGAGSAVWSADRPPTNPQEILDVLEAAVSGTRVGADPAPGD